MQVGGDDGQANSGTFGSTLLGEATVPMPVAVPTALGKIVLFKAKPKNDSQEFGLREFFYSFTTFDS